MGQPSKMFENPPPKILNHNNYQKLSNEEWMVQQKVKQRLKVGLSPYKILVFICFNEIPLKMMKNAFYFILKVLFVIEIFKVLSWHFGYVEK